MKKSFSWVVMITIILVSLTNLSNAQNVLDGVFVKEHYPTRKVVPYTHLREADVMWCKRIWRKMDLREKINHPLYFPAQKIKDRRSLTQVIMDAVNEGSLTAYRGDDEEFTTVMTKAEIDGIMSRTDTLFVDDPDNPGNQIMKIATNEFDPSEVIEYRIKEDWFFDKQRSVLDVRIIGLQPVKFEENEGEVRSKPLFWIYYPEARSIFANAEVFNRQNDSERKTLEDIFWKRMFGSYIFREQNVYNRTISEYAQGMDALLEAERVKDDIFKLEHDLWEY
jgi:gliding motility associated protien GldN